MNVFNNAPQFTGHFPFFRIPPILYLVSFKPAAGQQIYHIKVKVKVKVTL